MKILIVSQYYYPEQFQVNEIAPELVKRGHEVTVLCGLPNYPKGKVFPGYYLRTERLEKEKEYFEKNGVHVIHVNQVPRGKNLLKLLLNYWSFMRNSMAMVKRLKDKGLSFDVVLGYQLSPITSMYAALKYKKLTGVPVVYYTLDMWPMSAEAMLKSRNNPVYWWVKRISKKLYNGVDKVIVTSRPFIDYLHKDVELPLEKMVYLPQHASCEMIDMDLTKINVESLKLKERVDFMFAGNLGKGQRIDVVVSAARELGARKNYLVHIVGDGRMRVDLEQMVKEYGLLDNFVFYGNQKRADMPSFFKKADVLLISLRGNNEVGNTMPGKLQMYMTTGKPILGAINGAANEVITEAECGKCVAAGDYKGLAALMLDYIEHPEAYAHCGENARNYFMKNFTLDKYIEDLECELIKLVK